MRTAYDSTDPAAIPADARMVMWYLDGRESKWSPQDLERFPDAVKVSITVLGSPVADVADVENGDLTPASAAGWIRSRAGHKATIYCNLSTAPAVREACAGLTYDLWVADWNGEPHAITGAVAVQYADPAHGSGGQFDKSLVTDDSWYPTPPTYGETLEARATTLEAALAAVVHQAADLTDLIKAHK